MPTMWGLAVRGICEIDGQILLLKLRKDAAHDAGKWEIPGGKVKKNEFFDEALKREFFEETGLEIDIVSHYNTVDNNYTACKTNEKVKSIQLIMKVTADSRDVVVSSEHEDYRWFSCDEIRQLIKDDLLTKPAKNAFYK